MRSVELDIRNASGLHARPAAKFVRAAQGFQSDLRVRNLRRGAVSAAEPAESADDSTLTDAHADAPADADAKSILGVLGLGVGRGGRIEVTADGPDEDHAIDGLRELVESGLGEPGAAAASAEGCRD